MVKAHGQGSFLLVNLTLLEPEWEGYLTLELSNLGRSDIILNAGQGIAQIIFEEIKTPEITYADRNGKYQNQPNRPVAAIEKRLVAVYVLVSFKGT